VQGYLGLLIVFENDR